jgi:demethylmenaquinone methyltransferase/2-methoxy-6-polyprenyl-1,4-benzoquinol methylase
MPYESNTFDLIVCMLVLHEMDQRMRMSVIAEMKRVIKTDGRILLIDFHAGRARPPKGWLTKPIIFLSESVCGPQTLSELSTFYVDSRVARACR